MGETKVSKWVKGWQVSVATASLLLGFLLSVQFKSQADLRASAANIPSRRVEDLSTLLKDSEEKRISLENAVADLRTDLTKIKEKTSVVKSSNVNKETKGKLIMTGFTPLVGPGVEIILDDSKKPIEQGDNPNNSILHNEDLLKLTNELYASGAEAISINGNRLISNSEITCAGPTILVNKNRVTPPFHINAIGNSDTMIAALEMRGGIVEYLKFFGIEIKSERKEHVSIPAYNGSLNFKYSKPTQEINKEKV